MYGDLGNRRQRGVEVSARAVHVPSYTREWSIGCLVNEARRSPTQIAQRPYDFSLFLLPGGLPLLFTCVIHACGLPRLLPRSSIEPRECHKGEESASSRSSSRIFRVGDPAVSLYCEDCDCLVRCRCVSRYVLRADVTQLPVPRRESRIFVLPRTIRTTAMSVAKDL